MLLAILWKDSHGKKLREASNSQQETEFWQHKWAWKGILPVQATGWDYSPGPNAVATDVTDLEAVALS